jgi:hypothetical protein
MDAASAAAMSDPDRNPHFRRIWHDPAPPPVMTAMAARASSLGDLGLALLDAWRRKQAQRGEVAP